MSDEIESRSSVLREALGPRLRAEREARGWTPRKLAEKLSGASRGICAGPDVESLPRRNPRPLAVLCRHWPQAWRERGRRAVRQTVITSGIAHWNTVLHRDREGIGAMGGEAIMTADACTVLADMPHGELMRLVADGLRALGLCVDLPECEDGYSLSVQREGRRCELAVSDYGIISWECVPRASSEASPKLAADIATFLLTGKDAFHPCPGGAGSKPSGMTFLGITGNELRARGFDVGLEVYEDNQRFDVSADILVKNPVIHPTAQVYIGGDGAIIWECDYPYEIAEITDSPEYFAALADTRRLADSIVTRIARAISLSYGAANGNSQGEHR